MYKLFESALKLDTDYCVKLNLLSKNKCCRLFFKFFSRIGDGILWYIIMLILFLKFRDDAFLPLVHMAIVGCLGTIVYKVTKRFFNRPRPCHVNNQVSLNGNILDQFSFPSGHTLHAVIFSCILINYYPGSSALLIPITIFIALSRPVLGMHYPSDVLAGAALGFFIYFITMGYFYENIIYI